MKGKVKSLNVSEKKGVCKKPVKAFVLRAGWGVEDDAHAAPGNRQVSFLAWESIMKQKCCPKTGSGREDFDLKPGDFAENVTTEGIDFSRIKIGDSIKMGAAELKISKIGKECHTYCQIYRKLGDCIMPKEGIFAEVVKSGEVRVDDIVEVICED